MKKLILITGYDRCGKDYLANYLSVYYNAEILYLADVLKDIVSDILNIGKEDLEKCKNTEHSWIDIILNSDYKISITKNCREFIINVAGILRKYLGKDVFINILINKINSSKKDIIIIPDVRFLIEYEKLRKEYNAMVVKIDSELKECGKNGFRYEVDEIKEDIVFNNNLNKDIFNNNFSSLVDVINKKLLKDTDEK